MEVDLVGGFVGAVELWFSLDYRQGTISYNQRGCGVRTVQVSGEAGKEFGSFINSDWKVGAAPFMRPSWLGQSLV